MNIPKVAQQIITEQKWWTEKDVDGCWHIGTGNRSFADLGDGENAETTNPETTAKAICNAHRDAIERILADAVAPLVGALQKANYYFQLMDGSGNFLGDEAHIAWTAVTKALAGATTEGVQPQDAGLCRIAELAGYINRIAREKDSGECDGMMAGSTAIISIQRHSAEILRLIRDLPFAIKLEAIERESSTEGIPREAEKHDCRLCGRGHHPDSYGHSYLPREAL